VADDGRDCFWCGNSRDLHGYDMYFDRNGVPITMREWGDHGRDLAYKRVAEDQIGDYWVSTVWVGLDMGFHFGHTAPGETYQPIIFETMVFLRPDVTDDLSMDMDQWRYATEEQARAGHEAVCAEIRVKEQLISDERNAGKKPEQ
jgi:hypothetical protein